jgi:phospholipid/cholesterol/gamma-HCH transport system substrate-binding protein
LLADNRALLQSTVARLQATLQPLVDRKDELNDELIRAPAALKALGRTGGIYGDFFNFYLCDVTIVLNGLQPGGPVRTVKLLQQPTGRCTPK